ncbi:MAG: LacI family DNA-binding transcriptional regulator [Clostridia bacterium]|nr:LacI family DNA-binding transcriptional regulator [Clostridia bacterium]
MHSVTIRELAAACGVSIGTVSKALHRSERISEETIKKIEAKAAELGYVGNHAARALSVGRRTVAVVLPAAAEAERYRIGLEEAAPLAEAYGLSLCEVMAEEAAGYDAVLAHAAMPLPRLGDTPLVTLGGRHPTLRPSAECLPDFRVGGRLAAQFLGFATGGGVPAIVTARRGTYAEEEAIRGFRELSAKLGTTVAAVVECGDSARTAGVEMRRLLTANPRLRGLFLASPLVAPVTAALAEARKKLTVVAADFTRPAVEALRTGGVAALLYPAPERQAELAVHALGALFAKGQAAAVHPVRQELVLRSNLESYLI